MRYRRMSNKDASIIPPSFAGLSVVLHNDGVAEEVLDGDQKEPGLHLPGRVLPGVKLSNSPVSPALEVELNTNTLLPFRILVD